MPFSYTRADRTVKLRMTLALRDFLPYFWSSCRRKISRFYCRKITRKISYLTISDRGRSRISGACIRNKFYIIKMVLRCSNKIKLISTSSISIVIERYSITTIIQKINEFFEKGENCDERDKAEKGSKKIL